MDMEIALDMLRLAPRIEHAIPFSGDGDFAAFWKMFRASVEGVRCLDDKTSPPMAADALRRMADEFIEMEDLREHITRPPRATADPVEAQNG